MMIRMKTFFLLTTAVCLLSASFAAGQTRNEILIKNATIMASYVYHAAMAPTRIPRKTPPAR